MDRTRKIELEPGGEELCVIDALAELRGTGRQELIREGLGLAPLSESAHPPAGGPARLAEHLASRARQPGDRARKGTA